MMRKLLVLFGEKRIKESPRPHPRLLLTEPEEERFRRAISEEDVLRTAFSVIKDKADGFLGLPPCCRELQGRRLLAVSREVLTRIFYLCMAYRVLKEEKYASRAIEEMLAASRFSDWNPSHFIDTAELLVALSVGYDWLFYRMTCSQRKQIRKAIVSKGLLPSLEQRFWGKRTNWNSICRSGVAMGCLAVYESHRMILSHLLLRCLESRDTFLKAYFAGGGCPEGCHYWAYATTFEALMSLSLERSFGQDKWLISGWDELAKSARVVVMTTTPSGRAFSYGDSLPYAPIQYALAWFAAKTGDMSLLFPELEKFSQERFASDAEENRLLPLLLISGIGIRWSRIEAPAETFCLAGGTVPLFIFRNSWGNPDDSYLAVKGGRASHPHGHIDGGSFVFEADGVAWAVDLGKEDYFKIERAGVNLFDVSAGSRRWEIFRCAAESHNILTVSNSQPSVTADVPIRESWHSPQKEGCVLDMAACYEESLADWERAVFLDSEMNLNVVDTFCAGTSSAELRWAMCTEAEAEICSSREILLRKDGKERKLVIGSDLPVTPFINEAVPRFEYESPNPGKCMVGFSIANLVPGRKEEIAVRLIKTAASDGQPL